MNKGEATIIIQDFVDGAEDWADALLPEVKDKGCMVCGMKPLSIKELAIALKVIGF